MQSRLDCLPQGLSAIVLQINCKKEITQRLKDFGLVPGTAVMIRYRSPDKGVIALEFRSTVIAMRSKDLKGVLVQWV